jgi:hypothetical protein
MYAWSDSMSKPTNDSENETYRSSAGVWTSGLHTYLQVKIITAWIKYFCSLFYDALSGIQTHCLSAQAIKTYVSDSEASELNTEIK